MLQKGWKLASTQLRGVKGISLWTSGMGESLRKFILVLDAHLRNFSAIHTLKLGECHCLLVCKDSLLFIMNTLILLLPTTETGAGFQRRKL